VLRIYSDACGLTYNVRVGRLNAVKSVRVLVRPTESLLMAVVLAAPVVLPKDHTAALGTGIVADQPHEQPRDLPHSHPETPDKNPLQYITITRVGTATNSTSQVVSFTATDSNA
jgi:hypothetical protein